MTLTLEQIIALENYVLLGRRASGETGVLEKFRAAKSVLDDAGLTKQADALSRGYDLADAILALARERLQAGTFQQGIEAATTVVDAYDEYDSNLCCDGRECGCKGASVHEAMKHYIRNLKPEVGNG